MSELKERAGIAMNVRVQLADVAPDRQVTLGALATVDELGNMLWHMKYGQDLRRRALHRAALLLSTRIAEGSRFRRGKLSGIAKMRDAQRPDHERRSDESTLLVRFAENVILEWLGDQCSKCGGRGMLGGGGRIERRVDCVKCAPLREAVDTRTRFCHWPIADRSPCDACLGKGFVVEKPLPEVPHLCGHCDGSGKEPINHGRRAVALGVSLDVYWRRWVSRFEWLHSVLEQVDARTEEQFARRLQSR
ncbi:hypothetical protein PQR14_23250 [Paraburkholderia bryophila]|uniref:hypothetical protein n=1 Tax=Paraburkholderia bryophila TaxID=420952 RepID=UPI0038BCEC36